VSGRAAVTLMCVTVLMGVSPSAALAITRVKTDIVVSRSPDSRSLQITMSSRLHVPSDDPGVAGVASQAPHSAAQLKAIDRLFAGVGVSPATSYENRHEPTLTIGPSEAILRWTEIRSVFSLGDLPDWDPREQVDASPGLLNVYRVGRQLRLRVTGPVATSRCEWRVRVRLQEGSFTAVAPMPRQYAARDVNWRIDARSRQVPTVRAVFTVGRAFSRSQITRGRLWEILRTISFFVGQTLVLFLLLGWATSRRSRRQAAGARRLAVTGILLSLGSLATWLVNINGVSTWRAPGDSRWEAFATAFASLSVPLLAASVLLSLGRRRLERWRDGPVALWLLACWAAVAVLSFGATAGTALNPHPGLLADHRLRWLLAAGSALAVFALCLLLIAGLTTVFSAIWPDPKVRTVLARHRSAVWIALIVIAAGVVGQWVLSVRAGVAGDPFVGGPGPQPAWWDMLLVDVRFSPLGLLGVVQDLPVFLSAVALLGFLGSLSAERGAAAFSLRSWPLRVLMLFFCGLVIGTGGTVLDAQVPVAFVLGLLLTRLALRLPDGGVRPRALPPAVRGTLIASILRREDLRRRLGALRAKLTTGDIELAGYEAGRTALRTAADAVERSDVPPSLALELGPHDSLYDNGIAAARLGMRLAIVPIGYYVWVLLTERAARELSGSAPFGVLGLVAGLVREAGFWLVTAFAFGALLPYIRGREGVSKGLVLGGVFTMSVGVSSAIVGGYGNAWTFRALQVVLFLIVLGYLMDRRTLRCHGYERADLLDLYRLRDVRYLVGYASPLILLVIAVAEQLLSGHAADAVTKLIEAAPNALPKPQ
jgi:hypothetical protein